MQCVRLTKTTANNVAALLLYDWIFTFGVPYLKITDNDRSFCNEMIFLLSKRLGIKQLTSSLYHPEENAPIEAFHKTLNRGFRNFATSRLCFDEILKLIVLRYRVTPHSTTLNSPYYLAFGIDPKLSSDIDWIFEKSKNWQQRF